VDANENACRMFGLSREELAKVSLIDISAPVQLNGKPAAEEAKRHIQAALDGLSPVFIWLHRARGKDIPCEVRLVKLPSEDRTLVRGSITDISERVRSEDRQALMMRELDHRVKNNLATVLSLTEQSAANAASADELREALSGRIHAIANLHRALAQKQWTGMELAEVFAVTAAPYNGGEGIDRVRCAGPPCPVPPDKCSALCMVIHELSTNAVKYGSLSQPGGVVDVSWSVENGVVTIDWLESGGPAVAEPARTGYGTRLISGLIRHELGGSVDVDYATRGVHYRISIPVESAGPVDVAVGDS